MLLVFLVPSPSTLGNVFRATANPRPPTTVADVTELPFRAVGIVLIEDTNGDWNSCTGTAIDSPTRQLILTAGHCLYDRECAHCQLEIAHAEEFIPAYANEIAPYGVFAGESWRVPRRWRQEFDDNYDVGAIRTYPNALGQNVADIVGGGLKIAYDQPRRQAYRLLGYPGQGLWMRSCVAGFSGNDPDSRWLAGPQTLGVGCYMGDGSSGGPWLVDTDTAIAGIVSYSVDGDRAHLYSPYFSKRTVGALVAGL